MARSLFSISKLQCSILTSDNDSNRLIWCFLWDHRLIWWYQSKAPQAEILVFLGNTDNSFISRADPFDNRLKSMITSYRSPNYHRVIDGFVNPDRLIDGFLKLDRLIDGFGKCWSIDVIWFDDRYHQKRQTSINTPATVPQVCICSQTHIVYTTYICYLNTIVEHVQKVLQCFMTCWGNIISYWHAPTCACHIVQNAPQSFAATETEQRSLTLL